MPIPNFGLLFIFVSLYCISCNNEKNNPQLVNADTAIVSLDSFPVTRFEMIESDNEEDTIVKDGSPERLQPIRENFKKLNSIKNWTTIAEKYYEASIEGGNAKFYYQNNKLQKIITVSFGEMYRNLIEYYLMNGQLSFVFEKTFRYNRHFLYDSIAMKKNNDTEAFDLSKSTLIEVRSYFENDKLIYQISNKEREIYFPKENTSLEQKRILEAYDKLLKLAKEP